MTSTMRTTKAGTVKHYKNLAREAVALPPPLAPSLGRVIPRQAYNPGESPEALSMSPFEFERRVGAYLTGADDVSMSELDHLAWSAIGAFQAQLARLHGRPHPPERGSVYDLG